MSLKDSLNSAKARAENAKREIEEQNNAIQNYKEALKDSIDRIIYEATEEAYKSICDRIADEIYIRGSEPCASVEGYIELPDRLQIPTEIANVYQKYYKTRTDSLDVDEELYLETDEQGYSVRLTEIEREEIFWGYRNHLSLTKYGIIFIKAIQRQAINERIQTTVGVLVSIAGSDVQFREMSHYSCEIGRIGKSDIAYRLTLQYKYELTEAPFGKR